MSPWWIERPQGQTPQPLITASRSSTFTTPSPPGGAMSAGLPPPGAGPQLLMTNNRSSTSTCPLPPPRAMSAGHCCTRVPSTMVADTAPSPPGCQFGPVAKSIVLVKPLSSDAQFQTPFKPASAPDSQTIQYLTPASRTGCLTDFTVSST